MQAGRTVSALSGKTDPECCKIPIKGLNERKAKECAQIRKCDLVKGNFVQVQDKIKIQFASSCSKVRYTPLKTVQLKL